ncbi:MAG: hypothetical protein ABIA04_09725 [Pseudomonadota bacterium]
MHKREFVVECQGLTLRPQMKFIDTFSFGKDKYFRMMRNVALLINHIMPELMPKEEMSSGLKELDAWLDDNGAFAADPTMCIACIKQ